MRDIRPSQPPRPKFEPPEEEKKRELWSNVPKPKARFVGSKVPVANIHIDPPLSPKPAKILPTPVKPAVAATAGSAKPARPVSNPAPPKRPLFAATPVKPKKARMKLAIRDRKVVAGLLAVVILVGLLGAYLFLPKADVTLVLRTAPLLLDEELTIQAQAEGGQTIPGTAFLRELAVEGSAPVQSREVVGAKAVGTVQIVNRTVEEQKIKELSRLVTEDGTLFYMQKHAIVPPAAGGTPSRVSVSVEAAEAGPQGNIEPQKLNFAALDAASQSLVYAEATQALTGGSGEEISVVKEADLAAAQAAAQQQARVQAEGEIRGELPDGWVLLEESWTAEVTQFEPGVELESKSSEIPYTANLTVRVLGYEEAKLVEHLRSALESRLEDQFVLFPGPISFTSKVQEINWEEGKGTIVARVTHTTIPDISLDTLKAKLANRSETEARDYLEGLPGVQSATIDLAPFWVTAIPRIEKRIAIEVESERQP